MVHSILSLATTRDRVPIFSMEIDVMRGLPAAFLANGILIVTCVGLELTTPVLRVRTLSYCTHDITG